MSDDYDDYMSDAYEFLEEQLRLISEEPVFFYLAKYGDAIEARVSRCLEQARSLIDAGFHAQPLSALLRGSKLQYDSFSPGLLFRVPSCLMTGLNSFRKRFSTAELRRTKNSFPPFFATGTSTLQTLNFQTVHKHGR